MLLSLECIVNDRGKGVGVWVATSDVRKTEIRFGFGF